MEKDGLGEELLAKVDGEKREFLKKVILASAFAIPVISSVCLNQLRVEVSKAKGYGSTPWQ